MMITTFFQEIKFESHGPVKSKVLLGYQNLKSNYYMMNK